uniref:Uncharacterized protein n=1 Tax=uncultured Chromatiales bacterium HF0200_41F04 TaxID=710740 RepID=E0XV15_9GAMM|nr:hypothetical protein [uncultured Chromatiales bacterium HF0200_41F04]
MRDLNVFEGADRYYMYVFEKFTYITDVQASAPTKDLYFTHYIPAWGRFRVTVLTIPGVLKKRLYINCKF